MKRPMSWLKRLELIGQIVHMRNRIALFVEYGQYVGRPSATAIRNLRARNKFYETF